MIILVAFLGKLSHVVEFLKFYILYQFLHIKGSFNTFEDVFKLKTRIKKHFNKNSKNKRTIEQSID